MDYIIARKKIHKEKCAVDFRAFTVIEVIIVLVISGIIVAMGIFNSGNFAERNWGKNGETNLAVIYNAEKRYKLSNNEYFAYSSGDVKELNKGLGILIDDPFFTYSITREGDTFRAVATRTNNKNGHCTGKTMFITDVNSTAQKECEIWR